MYVHGCAKPIKYLYLQGHFSKTNFREMSFCYGQTISEWRKSLKLVDGNVDKAVKTSLKEKLEAYKAQVAGVGNAGIDKTKGKEAAI